MIRVVVADDEQKVSQLICNLIDWASLDMEIVGVAQNGIEALELVQNHAPNLIITDIRMPGCDGLDLVRRGKELNRDLEFIIISGYRQFEYAQTAVRYGVSDYLLKPIKKAELTATLEKMRLKYLQRTQQITREEQLQHRLQSDIGKLRAGLFAQFTAPAAPQKTTVTVAQLNADYHYNMQEGCFQACLLKIDGEYAALAEGGLKIVKEKSDAILRKNLSPLCHDLELALEDSAILALLNYAPDNAELVRWQLRTVLDELRATSRLFPSVVFTLALGSVENGPDCLFSSVAGARIAIEQRLLEGSGQMLEAAPLSDPFLGGETLLSQAGRAMESGLEIMDEDQVMSAVTKFSAAVLASPAVAGHHILHLTRSLCGDYLSLARKNKLNPPEAEHLYEYFWQRAQLCATAQEVMDTLEKSIRTSLHRALEEKRTEDTKPIRVAKQYIHTNYMQPLTLETVAGVAGFNASYFSSLFKKETGQNFLEYLSEVRMSRAKELLRDTPLSISAVCEQVGYLDLKYFTKSFKKATGIKPGEFRKLYS